MRVDYNWISENYYKYNESVFGGRLPRIDFGISMASGHGGWAKYQKDENTRTITPLKILISNYFDFTEEEAINVLLHEMIHIEDYEFHPEHFFMRGYDSHFSDFFQSEKKRINAMGFNITEYVIPEASVRGFELELTRKEEERKRIEAEKKKMGQSGESHIVGILKLNDKKGGKPVYLAVWTDEKYMEKVYYGFIEWANDYTSIVADKVDWYKCSSPDILDTPQCKGKITKNNELTFTYHPEVGIKNFGLVLFDSWSVVNRKVFDDDRKYFYRAIPSLLYNWKNKFIESFRRGYSFVDTANNFITEHIFRATDYFNKRNKKEYNIWLGYYDGFSFKNNRYEFNLYLPYNDETLSLLSYINNLRKENRLDEATLESVLNKCQELIRNQIMEILNEGNNMNESRINRIVSESISKYVEQNVDNEDKSIVSEKEVDDGVTIVTQW